MGGVSVANLGVVTEMREVDELQHDMGKRILGVSKKTSNAVTRGELVGKGSKRSHTPPILGKDSLDE